MKCPNDGATLTMSERSGVEIDYCPECRGVWLDRGELDKILDRASAELASSPTSTPDQRGYRQEQGYQSGSGYQKGQSHQGHRRPKRKEHWLSELFD